MYLTPLIRTATINTMFGAKCRQIVPWASLQSSLHMKAGKGCSSNEQGSREIGRAGMLRQGRWHKNLISQRDSHAGVTQLGKNVLFLMKVV